MPPVSRMGHVPAIVSRAKSLALPLLSRVRVACRGQGETLARDPTKDYFAGNDRDRAAFEAGIKLGSIYHQFIGAPLTRETARDLERAIEAGTRVQPLVEDVRVRIDRTRLHGRGPYKYASLGEDMLTAEVTIRVGQARATGVLRFVPELDYPLMYLKSVQGPPPKG